MTGYACYSTSKARKIIGKLEVLSNTRKLLLKKVPENVEATTKTLEQLENISARRELFQKIQSAPATFRESMGVEILRFNSRVCLEIKHLDRKSAFHKIDRETHASVQLPSVAWRQSKIYINQSYTVERISTKDYRIDSSLIEARTSKRNSLSCLFFLRFPTKMLARN